MEWVNNSHDILFDSGWGGIFAQTNLLGRRAVKGEYWYREAGFDLSVAMGVNNPDWSVRWEDEVLEVWVKLGVTLGYVQPPKIRDISSKYYPPPLVVAPTFWTRF